MAEQYYVQKKYDKAQQIFDEIFAYFKGDPRFEDMYFKYAYCGYYTKDYTNAENLFKTFTFHYYYLCMFGPTHSRWTVS